MGNDEEGCKELGEGSIPFSMKSKATPLEWRISILNGNAVMSQMPPSFGPLEGGPYI